MPRRKSSFLQYSYSVVQKHKGFFVPFVVFIFCGLAWSILIDHGQFVLLVNQNYSALADTFFYYLTYLGSGVAFIIVALYLMIFKDFRSGYYAIATFAVSSLIAQLLKRLVFDDRLRPSAYFKDMEGLHFVDGLTLYGMNSFPSGHTTTAFAMCLLLTIILRKNGLGFVFILLAGLIGFSRIYLFQHFFIDVFAGAIIGVITAFVLGYLVLEKWSGKNRPWLTGSLYSLIRG